MISNVYIIGSGGHARSLISLLLKMKYDIKGIYDDSFNIRSQELISGYKLIGMMCDIPEQYCLVLAVGDNNRRRVLFNNYHKQILQKNLLHSSSYLDENSNIGLSNQIFGFVYVNAETKVGNNNILNTGCILEHEVEIGSHNHISVGSILCGRNMIGDNCFIGAGSVVIDTIKICNDVIIGANSVVIKDITEPGTYIGNPVKKIK